MNKHFEFHTRYTNYTSIWLIYLNGRRLSHFYTWSKFLQQYKRDVSPQTPEKLHCCKISYMTSMRHGSSPESINGGVNWPPNCDEKTIYKEMLVKTEEQGQQVGKSGGYLWDISKPDKTGEEGKRKNLQQTRELLSRVFGLKLRRKTSCYWQ